MSLLGVNPHRLWEGQIAKYKQLDYSISMRSFGNKPVPVRSKTDNIIILWSYGSLSKLNR